jgi:hypothetical protein
MLVSGAITHIRNRTGHDTDQQIVDATMLLPWIEQETRRVRRELSLKCPEPFLKLSPILTVVTSGVIDLTSINDEFERIWSVEKRTAGNVSSSYDAANFWAEVPVYQDGDPCLGFREEGSTLRFYPEYLGEGSYRVKYILGIDATAFTTSTNLNSVTETGGGLPRGFEEVVIERVCATVCTRVPGDDPLPHLEEANRIWLAEVRALRNRYGRSARSGFRRLRRFV